MTAVATGGAVVPLYKLGNGAFTMERTPAVHALQRFRLYARAGNCGPWGRPVASYLCRETARSIAEARCRATGDWMRVEDSEPMGLFAVIEQCRVGVVRDAGGRRADVVWEVIRDADGKWVGQ